MREEAGTKSVKVGLKVERPGYSVTFVILRYNLIPRLSGLFKPWRPEGSCPSQIIASHNAFDKVRSSFFGT
jgi:hypothetical protein